MKHLRITFDDGSVYDLMKQNRIWVEAFTVKAKDNGMNPQEAASYVREHVDDYWKKRVVLTKFGTEAWTHDYDNKAELCADCMYAYIRAYLMAFIMEDLAKQDDRKPTPQVITVEDDGFKVIAREGAKPAKDLNEAVRITEQLKGKKKEEKHETSRRR